jgi:peptide/nickel transport system ATP-binding protein
MSDDHRTAVLEVDCLSVRYGRLHRKAAPPAVSDVSFTVAAGETVGLVGESGSGKTTIVKAILGLHSPATGAIRLDGNDITGLSAKERGVIALQLRVVFQDPYSSLSPFQTISDTLIEPLRGRGISNHECRQRAAEALESVGLPAEALDRYPTQFSGGQRQRIGLARALVTKPRLVVLDEPVSALDLSTQAQVLNLLAELRDHENYALLFVAHDLGVVRFLCQRVVVLYHGAVMEIGSASAVTSDPQHPYTIALTRAAPVPRPAEQARRRLARLAPRLDESTTQAGGCPYAPRCPLATDLCRTEQPKLMPLSDRAVACHYAGGDTRTPVDSY